LKGEVDAGVLIHESILNYSKELECEREIWDIWMELAKEELPLPLGGMAIRRSIPLLRALDYEDILTKAVKVANNHKKILSKMLLERDLIRVSEKELDKYLSLYANEDSVSLNQKQLKALDRLFEIGYENGFYDSPIKAEDYLLPREYRDFRFA